jgi:hypothetical protein
VFVSVVRLQERFYFGDGVLPLFESGIPLLLDRLKRLPDKDKVRAPAQHTAAWWLSADWLYSGHWV